MRTIALKLTVDEICGLLELVDHQILRVRFIDPKFPGHIANPARVKIAMSAIKTLRDAFNTAKGFRIREVIEIPAA
jgi:hypothetical protein